MTKLIVTGNNVSGICRDALPNLSIVRKAEIGNKLLKSVKKMVQKHQNTASISSTIKNLFLDMTYHWY